MSSDSLGLESCVDRVQLKIETPKFPLVSGRLGEKSLASALTAQAQRGRRAHVPLAARCRCRRAGLAKY